MAETVKKAKAPAKPRAKATTTRTTTAKKTVAEWAERGWQDGQAEQDWLRAERELMEMAS